ncbi:MAG: hypothetical protein WAJ94_06835 [Candidatus Cybelea sp.]
MSFSFLEVRTRLGAAAVAATLLPAFSACSGGGPAVPVTPPAARLVRPDANARPAGWDQFSYQTINDPQDPTTEVLGVNNLGKIVGYYGSGNHTTGFDATPPYEAQNFRNEDYPGGTQTEITSVSNAKSIAGWYRDKHGFIFGCILWQGIWTSYKDSHLRGSPTQLTKLYGLNDDGLAVGFYQDDHKVDHAFELDETQSRFHSIFPPGAKNAVATGISGKGDIVGYMTNADGDTIGWLLKGGHYTTFHHPNSDYTLPWAVNWQDDIVGEYKDQQGKTHGFILTQPLGSQTWQQIDEPNARGATSVHSVNDHHTMVGFYTDASHHIDGFLATPKK